MVERVAVTTGLSPRLEEREKIRQIDNKEISFVTKSLNDLEIMIRALQFRTITLCKNY